MGFDISMMWLVVEGTFGLDTKADITTVSQRKIWQRDSKFSFFLHGPDVSANLVELQA